MYQIENGLQYFAFEEGILDEVEVSAQGVALYMENVRILPENPHNRDIRVMRTNDLCVSFPKGMVQKVVRLGYKHYNADGVLMETVGDEELEPAAYANAWELMRGGVIDAFTKGEGVYTLEVTTEEDSYEVHVGACVDHEGWERFLNL